MLPLNQLTPAVLDGRCLVIFLPVSPFSDSPTLSAVASSAAGGPGLVGCAIVGLVGGFVGLLGGGGLAGLGFGFDCVSLGGSCPSSELGVVGLDLIILGARGEGRVECSDTPMRCNVSSSSSVGRMERKCC